MYIIPPRKRDLSMQNSIFLQKKKKIPTSRTLSWNLESDLIFFFLFYPHSGTNRFLSKFYFRYNERSDAAFRVVVEYCKKRHLHIFSKKRDLSLHLLQEKGI